MVIYPLDSFTVCYKFIFLEVFRDHLQGFPIFQLFLMETFTLDCLGKGKSLNRKYKFWYMKFLESPYNREEFLVEMGSPQTLYFYDYVPCQWAFREEYHLTVQFYTHHQFGLLTANGNAMKITTYFPFPKSWAFLIQPAYIYSHAHTRIYCTYVQPKK